MRRRLLLSSVSIDIPNCFADRVYDETCTNDDVYLHTGADIVAAAMDGIHGKPIINWPADY